MRHPSRLPFLVTSLLASLALGVASEASPSGGDQTGASAPEARPGLDTARIEELTGAQGAFDAQGGVFKVSVPRTDLAVSVGSVRLSPRQGLTSWAAFRRAGDQAMVMGDIVLLEAEVDPVMSAALDGRLEVTALHNHFLGEQPRVMFMHIGGHGPADQLAGAVGQVFRALEAARGLVAPTVLVTPTSTALDTRSLEEILDTSGQLKDGVFRVTIPRTARMFGVALGAAMGVNTWAAFAGTDREAVVDGDFAMYEEEVQPVLKALRKAGISVVALHNHMVGEEPRVVFLHYWGIGAAADLARGLRSALDAQGIGSRRER